TKKKDRILFRVYWKRSDIPYHVYHSLSNRTRSLAAPGTFRWLKNVPHYQMPLPTIIFIAIGNSIVFEMRGSLYDKWHKFHCSKVCNKFDLKDSERNHDGKQVSDPFSVVKSEL